MGTILLLTMGIEKSSGKIEVLEALCFKDFLAEWVKLVATTSIPLRVEICSFYEWIT